MAEEAEQEVYVSPDERMTVLAQRVTNSMTRRGRIIQSPVPIRALEKRYQHNTVRQQQHQAKLERQRIRAERQAQWELRSACHSFYERTKLLHVKRDDIAGHIYVVTPERARDAVSACCPCKIGLSKNPKKRLIALQGAHHELLVLRFVSPPLWNVQRIEESLHTTFRASNLRGEWFSLSKTQLEQLEQVIAVETELNRLLTDYHTAYQVNGGVNELWTEEEHRRDYLKLNTMMKEYWRLELKIRPVQFRIP